MKNRISLILILQLFGSYISLETINIVTPFIVFLKTFLSMYEYLSAFEIYDIFVPGDCEGWKQVLDLLELEL